MIVRGFEHINTVIQVKRNSANMPFVFRMFDTKKNKRATWYFITFSCRRSRQWLFWVKWTRRFRSLKHRQVTRMHHPHLVTTTRSTTRRRLKRVGVFCFTCQSISFPFQPYICCVYIMIFKACLIQLHQTQDFHTFSQTNHLINQLFPFIYGNVKHLEIFVVEINLSKISFHLLDMKIWIDPNEGADFDKLQASCEFRSKVSWTCIYPSKYEVPKSLHIWLNTSSLNYKGIWFF